MVYEGLFAVTFIPVRMVLGTIVSVRFVRDVGAILFNGTAHSQAAVAISLLSCVVLCFLQLYWGSFVVAEVYRVIFGRRAMSPAAAKADKAKQQ